jgi:type IV secretory pathway VirB10-like protein
LPFWPQQEVAMDELPPDARQFLERAKGVHDPHDALARERIERRLWSALALGNTNGVAHEQAASRVGASSVGSWLISGKVILASVVLAFMAAGAWLSMPQEGSEAAAIPSNASLSASTSASHAKELPQVSASRVRAGEAPAGGVPEPAGTDEQTKTAPARVLRAEAARRAQGSSAPLPRPSLSSSLAEEAALLARASDQLVQRDAQAALALLAEHGRRYPHSQLHEEHAGFVVMARCLRGSAEAAGEARAFVAQHPASVLIPRLSHLCGL